MDIAVIVVYLLAMVAVGWLGKRRATDQDGYLVAGRRLGPGMYAGTLAALVLGGASTIGGVGLGYQYGVSGMWLVVAIGCGVLVLSLAFAGRIQRLRVYTVSQVLELRYGPGATLLSAVVMAAYTFMLTVTSTIAYATVFGVLLDLGTVPSVLLGGGIVVAYSALGGMWSVTLTDVVQFAVQTVGVLLVLLPVVLVRADGTAGIRDALGDDGLDLTAIGGGTIVTYFVVYFFGILIGQDIWQRVFTARSAGVARGAGAAAGAYCIAYGVAGALIGAGAAALVPGLADPDDAFVEVAQEALPVGLTGLVLAAALAAIMSTASGALMATATVVRQDLVGGLRGRRAARAEGDEVQENRLYVIGFGLLVVAVACVLDDVVAALTVAYDILVGGLLVPILGGLLWRRGTVSGALAAMGAGTGVTLATMAVLGDVYANEPVYYGLGAGLVAFVAVSLATRPTDPAVARAWAERTAARAG
ncbi:sodium:solute symporter [Vallicoccus soli]|uniref:Sodium:solute symporter n=1 Tax=Vallicoccus soli TaxID=2339232 RepID=A0A3A3YZ48_9ACTN|nr:sodium:solute symporter [Vallicoccus soli]RJK96092.1 sodium:solute symporter [Vallicoccus soli]